MQQVDLKTHLMGMASSVSSCFDELHLMKSMNSLNITERSRGLVRDAFERDRMIEHSFQIIENKLIDVMKRLQGIEVQFCPPTAAPTCPNHTPPAV